MSQITSRPKQLVQVSGTAKKGIRSDNKIINRELLSPDQTMVEASSFYHIFADTFEPHPGEFNDQSCNRIVYQKARVSVPVVIKPFSFAGPATTLCCSDPVIKDFRCSGKKDHICYLTVSQEICVEIPLHFGAHVCTGQSWVDCLAASSENCSDCS